MGNGVQFPQSAKLKTTQIKLNNFLGVDYSDNVTSLKRAFNMTNMIRENEILQMRHPLKYEAKTVFENKINGIYEFHIMKTNIDAVIIHSGTNILMRPKREQQTEDDEPIVFTNVISDNESVATVLDNKLIIFDGVNPVIVYQSDESEDGLDVSYLYDYENLYIPTTSIGRAPDGTSNVFYEAPNRINNYRQNWFTTEANQDDVAASLVLDEVIYTEHNEKFKVEELNYLGKWIDVTEYASIKGPNTIDVQYVLNTNPIYNNKLNDSDNFTYLDLNRLTSIKTSADVDIPFTFNDTDYTISFITPVATTIDITQYKYQFTLNGIDNTYTIVNVIPIYNDNSTQIIGVKFKDIGLPQIRGNDNIKVTFAVDMSPYKEEITSISILTKYGYQANMNRLFVSGNITNGNVVLWSAANDPTYFPEDHWTKVGESPVIDFSLSRDGTLVIHKKKQTDNITTYYMGSDLGVLADKYERTTEVFPIVSGVGDFELVNKNLTDTYLNDPCFLTKNGVYCISTGTTVDRNDERFSEERSYYIRQAIPSILDDNPKKLIQYGNALFLFTETMFYIADKTTVSYSPEGIVQYEWYPCKSKLFEQNEGNEINHRITSVNVCWNVLYVGDNAGIIYRYDINDLSYYDGDYLYSEDQVVLPIEAEWVSQPIYGDIIEYTKTLTNIYINYLPYAYNNKFDVSVMTTDEDKNVSQEWYTVENNLGKSFTEDFADYDKYRKIWTGPMSYKFNSSKTFKIKQRCNNFNECQIKLTTASYEDVNLDEMLTPYTTHMSLRSITLDMMIGKKVR